MVDRSFEMELDRQFSVSPMLPDSDYFAARVGARLDRGWAFRHLMIGGLGLAGGLIGAGQLLGSGLLSRMQVLANHSNALINTGVITKLPVARGLAELFSAGSGVDGQVLWMSAALAALAVGLFVTRVIREF
jgi:hypothetical protein